MSKRNLKQEGMQRAYSKFEIKEINDEERVIEGWATTPTPDSMDDVVEPEGAEFALPIPLLWQHKRSEPIGHVIAAEVTAKGIWVKCKFVKIAEAGRLKERLDEAWQSVKYHLVQAFSIGFDPIEYSQIDGSWGLHFLRWKWLELSAVTLPANSDCSIESIKSIDTQTRAALGQTRRGVVRLGDTSPGVSGNSSTSTKEMKMKTIQERIADFTAERAKALASIEEIVNKSLESGETLDAEQKTKRKELTDRVAEIDEHIAMLKETEQLLVKQAPASRVEDGEGERSGLQVRAGARISVESEKLEKGIAFARYVKCLAAARGNRFEAHEIAKQHYPEMKPLHTILKSAVGAGSTTDANWAGNLVEYNLYAQDFIDFLRPMTIIGKFGSNGIPSLFRVPFNIEIPRQTSGGTGYWVGQGKAKPLTSFAFDRVNLGFAKVANIAVLTDEIIRFSNPGAEPLVRKALADSLLETLDGDFLNPSVAAVANVSPASLTYGVTPVAASGTDADAVRADVANVIKKFIDANLSLSNGVWVMSAVTAMRLMLMRNSLGQKEFPNITMTGGTFEGLPVIVSQHVAGSVSGGNMVVLMDAGEVYLADDGQVVVDASREASLQMDNAPSGDSVAGTGSSVVSMFQTNSVALRAERWINWAKRRADGVQYIDGTHWGE